MEKPKPQPFNGMSNRQKHQLGALAFIGIILYLVFLPQGDFIDLVSMAPYLSLEKGELAIQQMGYNPNEFKLKSHSVQKLVGIGQLTYINRFCDIGAIEKIRDLGVPMSLYRLEYVRGEDIIRVWVDPSDGRIFTVAESPHIQPSSRYFEEIPTPEEAIEMVQKTRGVIDSLLGRHEETAEHEIIDTVEAKEAEAEDLFVVDTLPAAMQIAQLGRNGIILAGIDINRFELIDFIEKGDRHHLIWQSGIICEGALVRIRQDIYDGKVRNMQASLALPEYWFLERASVFSYIRWTLIGLFIAFSIFLVLRRFIKSIDRENLWDKSYNKIVLLVFIVELLSTANLIPSQYDIEGLSILFVSRFFFFSVTAIIAWRTMGTLVNPIIDCRRDRLLYYRDGILMGLLSAISLMGLHHFLLWVVGRSGLMTSSSFLLGQRSISTIPSYSGLFPAMNTIQQLFEATVTLLPMVLTLYALFMLKFKRKRYFQLLVFVSIAVGTLVQGTTPQLFLILLIGNLVLGVFAYFLITTYTKTNIPAYITAIMTYILITDAFHYLRGAISSYFIINALVLVALAMIPAFVLLHLSFFTEIKEKFEGPIE